MRTPDYLGDDYDMAYDSIQDKVKEMRRELSAILMLEFPDKTFLLEQANLLQESTGVTIAQINVILDDRQVTVVSEPDKVTVAVELDTQNSLCVFTVVGDETLAISNIREHEFMADHPGKDVWGSWASSPVKVAGQSAGTVCAMDKEARNWSEEDVVLLEMIADTISKAVNRWAGNPVEDGLK